MKYCESIYETKRRKTREVLVGSVGVGGANPVRIQSMTNSNTRDVAATIDQIMRLADAGCEIARVTVQGKKEAEACEAIRNGLIQKGYTIPMVADIHFYPPAALMVADFVEKVRINPGNFADKRASFKVIEYDDASYQAELDRIREKFSPLVEKCKKLGRAMRIGTNHGSLSDRIMNRYGDTPMGMVESAFEFTRICREMDYHDLIFSMKASNPLVMIQAYRLLAAEMDKLGWDYPLHLGVTEAGEGEDGRVKSAMGIGSLLLDGLGDTIRVSLTEDPWAEIDPCKRLVAFGASYIGQGVEPFEETGRKWNEISRRPIDWPTSVPLHRDGTVVIPAKENPGLDSPMPPDAVVGNRPELLEHGIGSYPSIPTLEELKFQPAAAPQAVRVETAKDWDLLKKFRPAVIFLAPKTNRLHFSRRFFEWLHQNSLSIPVILNFSYDADAVIRASAECGALLADGLGEGLCLEAPMDVRLLSFNILQAARMRTTKTEFISCPSCGRTLFDLQDVSRRIRERTDHLPGVKIAIMGCIVNGPGEMADAHFGYVGSKPGKIDLYVGKECVERDIDFADADDRLIELIKKHEMWVEPQLQLV